MDEQRLDGKIALVTGAARGIGRAAALELARRGATVAAAVRTMATAGELERELRECSPASVVLVCDVAQYAALEAAVAQMGRIDILVNNAGVIEPIAGIAEVEPARWAEAISINLIGAFHGCRAVLPGMLERGSGTIINVSSGAANRALEGWSAYCASKAGMAMLTRSLQLEYGARGIRAYDFRPGVVDTNMQVIIRASGVNEVSTLRREDLASPTETARAIAYLCSDAAADLAGSDVDIRDPAFSQRF